MRKGILLWLACFVALVCSEAQAQGRFGIGFMIGDPTGFSAKYKLSQQNAIDGVLGFSPFDRFRLHVDYLWMSYPFNDKNLSLSYGVGAAVGFGRTEYIVAKGKNVYFTRSVSTGFGIRTAIGLNYMVPRSPVELTLELAPILVLSPDSGFGIDGGLGVRFYP